MEKFFYRVNDGDSVFSVAERFNVSVTALIKQNNLSKEIEAGDLLYIETEPCTLYKVRPEDTALSVAKRFGTSEQKILSDNAVPYVFYGLTIKV